MSETRGDPQYTMGRSKEEEDRLIQQSQLYEAVTRRLLGSAGLDRGMRVLDIGSGAGDVAMTAAELVGPDGSVVGVDMNPEIVETARTRAREAGFANIEFVAGDARDLDPGHDFDALVGRLVLMYMADPAAALRQLSARVRPGGIVAFQEIEFSPYRPVRRDDTPLMNQLVDWGVGVFERAGAHVDMGLDLYRAYVEAGLPEPHMHFEAPVGGPDGWEGYSFMANSFRSLVPILEQFGMATAGEVDVDTLAERIRREVTASKRPLILPPHVTAWARLPA